MSFGTPEVLVRFSAKDREGNEYLLTQYTMVTHSGTISDSHQADAGEQGNRVLYIVTEDRRLVLRTAKGKYKISTPAETLLFSDDPQAP
ncbi:hypothetical protein [Aureliella helgolandensis]|uniref:Uncharacterized protein n=1 Tax=Aureliella helgolandensis TaxID=2527968 RepID=A0A518G5H3_9BACT|nr:hypothetical protein [Aureliella helgolandensis]QDV23835.1 hypothetical protein Q31a_21410 [Aureliella helgolandensis]